MDDKMKEIVEAMRLFEASDFTAMQLELDGIRIELCKEGGEIDPASRPVAAAELQPQAAVAGGADPAPAAPPAPAPAEEAREIRAPILGTFCRAAGPGEAPMIEVGQEVEPGQALARIECFERVATVEAGCGGTLIRIAAEDASLVEYDQPLFYVQPASRETR